MKGTVRLQISLMLAAVLVLTACQELTSSNRYTVFRTVAAAIVHPFLEAQASAALTQTSIKKTRPAKPEMYRLHMTIEVTPKAERPAEVELALPEQRFLRAKLAPGTAGGRCGCTSKPAVSLSTAS